MAHHHHLPKWAVRTLNITRTVEEMVERHWPFAAYALLSLAITAYIVGQLARIFA